MEEVPEVENETGTCPLGYLIHTIKFSKRIEELLLKYPKCTINQILKEINQVKRVDITKLGLLLGINLKEPLTPAVSPQAVGFFFLGHLANQTDYRCMRVVRGKCSVNCALTKAQESKLEDVYDTFNNLNLSKGRGSFKTRLVALLNRPKHKLPRIECHCGKTFIQGYKYFFVDPPDILTANLFGSKKVRFETQFEINGVFVQEQNVKYRLITVVADAKQEEHCENFVIHKGQIFLQNNTTVTLVGEDNGELVVETPMYAVYERVKSTDGGKVDTCLIEKISDEDLPDVYSDNDFETSSRRSSRNSNTICCTKGRNDFLTGTLQRNGKVSEHICSCNSGGSCDNMKRQMTLCCRNPCDINEDLCCSSLDELSGRSDNERAVVSLDSTNDFPPLITMEDIEDIKRCFQEVDKDCDGWINAEELCKFMELRETDIGWQNAENIVYHADPEYHYSINRNQLIYLAGKYGVSTACSVKLTNQEYHFALCSLRTSQVNDYRCVLYNHLSKRSKENFNGTVNYFEEKAEREDMEGCCDKSRTRNRNTRKIGSKECYTTDSMYRSHLANRNRTLVNAFTVNDNKSKFSSSTTTTEKKTESLASENHSDLYLDFESLKKNWEERIEKELINIRRSQDIFLRLHKDSTSYRNRRFDDNSQYCERTNSNNVPPPYRRRKTDSKNIKYDHFKNSNKSLKTTKSEAIQTKPNSSSSLKTKSESSFSSKASSTKKSDKRRKSKKKKPKKDQSNSKKGLKQKLDEEENEITEDPTAIPLPSSASEKSATSSSKKIRKKGSRSSSKVNLPLKSKSENSIPKKTSKKSFFSRFSKNDINSSSKDKSNKGLDLDLGKGDSTVKLLDQKKSKNDKIKKSKRSKAKKSKKRKSKKSLKGSKSGSVSENSSFVDISQSSSPSRSKSGMQMEISSEMDVTKGSEAYSARRQISNHLINVYDDNKQQRVSKSIGSRKSELITPRKPSRNFSSAESFTSTREIYSKPEDEILNQKSSFRIKPSEDGVNSKASNLSLQKSKINIGPTSPNSMGSFFPSNSANSLPNNGLDRSKSVIPSPPPIVPLLATKPAAKKKSKKTRSKLSVSSKSNRSKSSIFSRSGVSVENVEKQARVGTATSVFSGNFPRSKSKKKVTFKDDKKSVQKSGLSSRMTM